MKLVMIALLLAITTCQAQFPAAPLGMCQEGSRIASYYYPGHQVQYAYASGNPGHVWLWVDGTTPVDSYFGVEPRTLEWIPQPQYLFNSYQDLESYLGQTHIPDAGEIWRR